MATESKTIIATVAVANDRGIKLADSQLWHNYSRFADAGAIPDEPPRSGSKVGLTFDKAGFIRRCEPVTNGHQPTASPETQTAQPDTATGQGQAPDREAVITRLAVLNTATAILSSGGRPVDPVTLLDLAAQLEAWANRAV